MERDRCGRRPSARARARARGERWAEGERRCGPKQPRGGAACSQRAPACHWAGELLLAIARTLSDDHSGSTPIVLRYAKLVRCSSRFGLRQAGGGPLSKASSKWSRTASELAARATHEEEPQQPRSRRRPSNGCSGVEREDNLGRLYLGADTNAGAGAGAGGVLGGGEHGPSCTCQCS